MLLLFRTKRMLPVPDNAREQNVARSTAHRLPGAIAERGLAAQDPGTRAYIAGLVLIEVLIAAVSMLYVRDRARSMMAGLLKEVRETVSLVVLGGALRSSRGDPLP